MRTRWIFCGCVVLGGCFSSLIASAAEFQVTASTRTGTGSIQEALGLAAANPGPDTITFAPAVTVIDMPTGLFISDPDPVAIEGNGTVEFVFTGVSNGTQDCFSLDTGGHSLSGLRINGFPADGVDVFEDAEGVSLIDLEIGNCGQAGIRSAGDNVRIQGCVLGALNGVLAPNGADGIVLSGGAGCVIGLDEGGFGLGNVVLGGTTGIRLADGSGTLLRGNYVGVNMSETLAAGTSQHGIVIVAPDAIVQDNVVRSSFFAGIIVAGSDSGGVVLRGNHVSDCGFNDSPSAPKAGIFVNDIVNGVIGGTESDEHNTIVDNNIGLELRGDCTNVLFVGNHIGVEADGQTGNGNASHGIVVQNATGGLLGGETMGSGNIVANNGGVGVYIQGGEGQSVLGNLIGLNGAGAPAGNSGDGVRVDGGADDLQIGLPTGGNSIAYNAGNGIDASNALTIRISGNGIFLNSGDGIVLASGVNNNISAPQLTAVTPAIVGTTIPNGQIEFFADTEDEGAVYLGSAMADNGGAFSTVLDLSAHVGQFLTATVSDSQGRTSPFSSPIAIVGAGALHSADQNGDQVISLSELLRVIQFFNSGGLGCGVDTEDGYAPNSPETNCAPHSSDYNPQNWVISLSELLRLIQFFNSGGYTSCPEASSEDGFCAGLDGA